MATTAGMVKTVVVKSGAAGMTTKMTCEQIYGCFDPPIKFGPHSKMVGSLAEHQAEHIIPTSAFHDLGRSGGKQPGCSGYSTSSATTWMVRDGQSENQEHKRLTDPMREFSQKNDLANKNAPLSEWLEKYEEGTKDALKNSKPRRAITNKELDEDSLIAQAAECIREQAAESFAAMDPPVKPDTPLRNPWAATKDQIKNKPPAPPSTPFGSDPL